MAPIPFIKVGFLIIRTLAKPLAARLMADAKNHPAVERACVFFGQAVHQVSSRINILASGYRIIGVPPLPKEEALNTGVAVMSEMVVFCVAGSILVYEYQASEKSSAEKAAIAAKKSADEKQRLEDRLTSMDAQLLILADKLQNLEKVQGQQQANGTAGAIPYSWIFGVPGMENAGRGARGSTAVDPLAGKGKVTENLPSTLEEDEVITVNSATAATPSSGGSGGVGKEQPAWVVTLPLTPGSDVSSSNTASGSGSGSPAQGGSAAPTASGSSGTSTGGTRTWYDWWMGR